MTLPALLAFLANPAFWSGVGKFVGSAAGAYGSGKLGNLLGEAGGGGDTAMGVSPLQQGGRVPITPVIAQYLQRQPSIYEIMYSLLGGQRIR